MKPEPQVTTVELSGGKRITLETGKLAKQAHGSAVVCLSDNVILATAAANAARFSNLPPTDAALAPQREAGHVRIADEQLIINPTSGKIPNSLHNNKRVCTKDSGEMIEQGGKQGKKKTGVSTSESRNDR